MENLFGKCAVSPKKGLSLHLVVTVILLTKEIFVMKNLMTWAVALTTVTVGFTSCGVDMPHPTDSSFESEEVGH